MEILLISAIGLKFPGSFKLPDLCSGVVLVYLIFDGKYYRSIMLWNHFARNGTRANENFLKK